MLISKYTEKGELKRYELDLKTRVRVCQRKAQGRSRGEETKGRARKGRT